SRVRSGSVRSRRTSTSAWGGPTPPSACVARPTCLPSTSTADEGSGASARQRRQAGRRLLEHRLLLAEGEPDQVPTAGGIEVEDGVGHGDDAAAVRKGTAER